MRDFNKYYISIVQKTDEQYHRSKIIIHKPSMFHFAEFENINQLELFSKMLGFTYELTEEKESERFGLYQEYSISHDIKDVCGGGFWKVEDLPDGVKPFKALSNGSIVDCYFLNDSKNITIYRPNPNAKEIYKPLEIQEHIKHVKTYGLY